MILYGLLMFFFIFIIVGPRPIFGYLVISNSFALFSDGFTICSIELYRRPSPDRGYLLISYDFVLFSHVSSICLIDFVIVGPRPIFGYLVISNSCALFSDGLTIFPIDFYRRPSPDLEVIL